MRRHLHAIGIFLLALTSTTHGQLGVSQLVTFTNKMIPHVLLGLTNNGENVVYSPLGVSTALAMVLDGVGVKMASEITKTLGLGGPNVRQLIRQGAQALLTHLQTHEKDEDKIGTYNRASVHSSTPLIPEYRTILENYYKAVVTDNITGDATDLVLELQTDVGVMSHWKDYDKLAVYTYLSHQAAAAFLTANGSTTLVPMIPQIGNFRAGYLPKLNSQAVELPLSNDHAVLLMIMPDYRDGMDDVLVKLVNENVASLSSSLPLTDAEVTLPQFAIVSSDLDIGKVLRKSGLDYIFTKKTIKSGRGPVKSMKQNGFFATSFISVNSVATSHSTLYKNLQMKSRKKRDSITTSFSFNKPFIFLLIHKLSGATLLAGVVKVPTQVPT